MFSLFGTSNLYAGEVTGQVTGQVAVQPSLIESMIPFLLIFVVMYFILIRPQAKKAKAHKVLLESLKVGDEVVTSGGIIGRIKSLAETFVTLEVGNASLKVLKEHVVLATRGSKK